MDINGDGNLDLLTASFNGFSYIFNSFKGGGFSAATEITDENGEILHLGHYYDSKVRKDWTDDKRQALKRKNLSKEERARIEKMVTDHCCKTKAVDWDNDGDYDLLLIGQRVSLCINKGTKSKPVFSSKKTIIPNVQACTIADWDGDGLWDILGASKFGGDIYFYKNIGKLGTPKFDKGQTVLLASDFKSVEGSKTSSFQLAAVDYNNDGKLDLVIGSNTSEPRPAPVMTEALIKEKANLEKRYKEVKARRAEISASYKKKYSDPDEYRAEIRKNKEFNDLYDQYGRLYSKISMFSAGITNHGYLWVSIRK